MSSSKSNTLFNYNFHKVKTEITRMDVNIVKENPENTSINQITEVKQENPFEILSILPSTAVAAKNVVIKKEVDEDSSNDKDSDYSESEFKDDEDLIYPKNGLRKSKESKQCSKCKLLCINFQFHKCIQKPFAQCSKCLLYIVGVTKLTNHVCREKIKCPKCPKMFYKENMYNHMYIHDRKNFQKCPYCNKVNHKVIIKSHIKNVHKTARNFECDHCDLKSKRKNDIECHMVVHMRERPFTCDVCKKGFNEERYFKEHKLNHDNPNPFKCKKCNKGYTRQTSLSRHMQTTHSEIRRYKCDQCMYAGKTGDDLTTHKKTHTKLFKCDLCTKKFSRSSLLKEHRVLHDNPRAYSCKICEANYNQKKTLKYHMLKVHSD